MAGTCGTPGVFLGRELRRAREAKGISRTALARQFYVSESLVKLWETGRRVPTQEHLSRLDELFEMDGLFVRFREDLVRTSVPLEWFGRWPEIESRATALWSVHAHVFPGLLQTEAYARAVLHAGNHLADLDELVNARLERQQVLLKEDPPMIVALLIESTLQYGTGGPKIMHDELMHIADLTQREDVIIQIIPNRAPACARFTGPFVIANFDGGDDVAYVDSAIAGEVIEDRDDIVRLRRIFDMLRAAALSQDASIELMEKVAREWTS
ncbi:helix-turn-helix transcriptional regulator [Sphaerisporangium sp. NPDC005288]|uniref:helix-turn-helix domain-containing protein n=1 Tax=Sphaerisporangium sp. NPDC005288 TaxID=3155114 RepID=UPI0033B9388D